MEPKENNKNWFNDICKNVIAERNELRKKALQNPSDECIRKYEEQRKLANKILRREKIYMKRGKQKKYKMRNITQKSFSK